jgi:hypothetical protein
MTVGATLGCAPFMLGSLLAPDSTTSFAALLVGFCLSGMKATDKATDKTTDHR